MKVGTDTVNFIYCVTNIPEPPKRYYHYFFFSHFFSLPLFFHLKFCSVSFFVVPDSFNFSVLHSFIVSGVVVPLPVCITFINFFLKECCLFLLSQRCVILVESCVIVGCLKEGGIVTNCILLSSLQVW